MALSSSLFLQLRSSGVCLFVSVYISLFIVATVVLFTPLFRTNLPRRPPSPDVHAKEDFSNDFEWENSLFLNLSVLGTFSHSARALRWPLTEAGPLNCSTLQDVKDLEFIAAGWTKAVYRGSFRGMPVAIKTVNLNGHDFRQCQELQPQVNLAFCYRKTAAKLLKELILLTELAHENIVKVLGSCVPDAVGPVVIVTELGEPLDTVQLLQLSWQQRLQLVHNVARLLYHLAHSPLGSLAMNDLRRQQFVLVDGSLKLSDVDDMGVAEPFCEMDTDCLQHVVANISDQLVAKCVGGRCHGHNERLNVRRAGQHLVRQLLPLRAPSDLEPQIHLLLEAYANSSWDSARILTATEQLFHSFSADAMPYATSESQGFRELPDSDLPGQYDYWCQSSETQTDCTLTVASRSEAVTLCQRDWHCRAVVVQPCSYPSTCDEIKVTLKNGFATPSTIRGSLLLLKPS